MPTIIGFAFAGSCAAMLGSGSAVLAARRTAMLVPRPETIGPDDVLLGCAAVGLAGIAAYLAVVLTTVSLCLAADTRGNGWQAGRELVATLAPGVARRVLGVGGGVSLTLALALPATAGAAPGDAGAAPTRPATTQAAPGREHHDGVAPPNAAPDLAWGHAPTNPPATTKSPRRGSIHRAARTVTVEEGDSLWGIAREELGPGATDAQITDLWPRIFAANAERLGPDPDLIHPGVELSIDGPRTEE